MAEPNSKAKRVPWKTTKEWLYVKNKVISQDHTDLIRGYELLLMWKARCPNLPVHVECTLGVLQVLAKDHDLGSNKNTLFNKEEDLQLCYSTALLRFVNHVSASNSPLSDTLYLVARKQNIPDWVVNLRHEIAHSATLPPISLLEAAILLGKQWLIENYWEPVEKDLMDIEGSSMNSTLKESTGFVHSIIKEAIKVWWTCQHKILVTDLTENEWLILLNVGEKFSDYKLIKTEPVVQALHSLIKPCKKERVTPKGKRKLLRKIAKNILNIMEILYKKESKKVNKYILEGLVEAGFLTSAGNDLNEWGPLLQVLHNVDSLQVLLEFLFEKLNGTNVENATYAEGWLVALSPSLNNLRFRWKQFHEKENSKEVSNGIENSLFLPLRQPPCIRFEALRPSLMNPTSTLLFIFENYVNFASPCIPKQARSIITKLMKIYTNEQSDEMVVDTQDLSDFHLFSVQDLTVNIPVLNQNGHITENNGQWQKVVTETDEWRRCAIGILPNQIDLNFELPSMEWYEDLQKSRKRKAVDELEVEKT